MLAGIELVLVLTCGLSLEILHLGISHTNTLADTEQTEPTTPAVGQVLPRCLHRLGSSPSPISPHPKLPANVHPWRPQDTLSSWVPATHTGDLN